MTKSKAIWIGSDVYTRDVHRPRPFLFQSFYCSQNIGGNRKMATVCKRQIIEQQISENVKKNTMLEFYFNPLHKRHAQIYVCYII